MNRRERTGRIANIGADGVAEKSGVFRSFLHRYLVPTRGGGAERAHVSQTAQGHERLPQAQPRSWSCCESAATLMELLREYYAATVIEVRRAGSLISPTNRNPGGRAVAKSSLLLPLKAAQV